MPGFVARRPCSIPVPEFMYAYPTTARHRRAGHRPCFAAILAQATLHRRYFGRTSVRSCAGISIWGCGTPSHPMAIKGLCQPRRRGVIPVAFDVERLSAVHLPAVRRGIRSGRNCRGQRRGLRAECASDGLRVERIWHAIGCLGLSRVGIWHPGERNGRRCVGLWRIIPSARHELNGGGHGCFGTGLELNGGGGVRKRPRI